MSTPRGTRDVVATRRGRTRKKIVEQQYEADLGQLMATAWGRRLVWTWLQRSNIFHSTFSTHSGEMSFREGQRNAGLQLLNEVVAIAPLQYDEMTRENRPTQGAEQTEDDTDTDE